MVKKELIIALMVISMFLVSACDVYNTLYVKEPEVEEEEWEAVEISEEDIIIDIEEFDTGEELEGGIEDITGEIIEAIEVEEEEEIIEEIGIEEILEEIEIEEEEELIEEIGIEEIFEEEAEKEIPEDATVVIVEETGLISLVPKAEDPDMDVLTFTFTSPLDDNGEWQTAYGDAGEYTVTVTASDGLLTSSREVLIIVNKKEEAPVLESFRPEETAMEIDETKAIEFSVAAADLNNDDLTYSWKLDGVEIGNENSVQYQTTYEDAGSHTVKVTVSDSTLDTEKIWSVTVNNVNRKPVLKEVGDIEAKETDTVVVLLEASDLDGDELSYAIDDNRFIQDGNSFTWETTYDDDGDHVITATVSDGVDTVSQVFTITVENVNRAPIIFDIIQK